MKRFFRAVISFLSGDFIVEKGWDRQIWFVLFVFVMVCVSIFWSLMVENTLVKVRDNDKVIESLEIARDQRAIELLGMDHLARIEELLKQNGSTLLAPTEPPAIVKD